VLFAAQGNPQNVVANGLQSSPREFIFSLTVRLRPPGTLRNIHPRHRAGRDGASTIESERNTALAVLLNLARTSRAVFRRVQELHGPPRRSLMPVQLLKTLKNCSRGTFNSYMARKTAPASRARVARTPEGALETVARVARASGAVFWRLRDLHGPSGVPGDLRNVHPAVREQPQETISGSMERHACDCLLITDY
jgi:hypothetical protein